MKNDYEIRGEVTAIFLTRKDGTKLETIIDTSDLDKTLMYKGSLCASWCKCVKSYYARGVIKGKGFRFHRYLLDTPTNMQVDHLNHDTLDNRRSCNIFNVTALQNNKNRRLKGTAENKVMPPSNTSGTMNVMWRGERNKWIAYFKHKGKKITVGHYSDKQEAIDAITEAKKLYYPA